MAEKGEKMVGKKEEEVMDKVKMAAILEAKGAATWQRVEEKEVTTGEILAAIEEGTEEEEDGTEEEDEVEKEREAVGGIGNKKRCDHLEHCWCTSSSFSKKGEMKITLTSSNGERFKMSKAAARLSSILADMIDDKGFSNDNIPLPHVPSNALVMVIKYCNKHAAAAAIKPNVDHNMTNISTVENITTFEYEKMLEEWDRKLVDNLTTDDLFDLMNAANFLDIKDLQDITCQKTADIIRGKTPEQLREIFHIVSDFTKEEEEEILQEKLWANN